MCVTSKYDSSTKTTAYGIEVATGDNITIDSTNKISGLKTTVTAADQKVTVTSTGGFNEANDYAIEYEVGINISDNAYNALKCEGW